MTVDLYPKQIEAYRLVKRAKESGDLVVGDCLRAHAGDCRGRVEAHHENYDKPLDVLWLCARHHRELHEIRRKAAA